MSIQIPETGFLRIQQIIGDKKANPPIPGLIPMCRWSWYQGIKKGDFPKPIKNGRMSLWRVEDVRACIESMGSRNGK